MMEPLYPELHGVVREMEAEHVIANGGYESDNPYWKKLSDYETNTQWPEGSTADYRWTYSRMAVMGVQ